MKVFDLVENVSPELIENFLQAATGGGSDTIVRLVSMPLNGEQFKGFERVDKFYKVARDVTNAWPQAEAFNATRLFPAELFYGGRHMRPEAHKMFADTLLALLPSPARVQE